MLKNYVLITKEICQKFVSHKISIKNVLLWRRGFTEGKEPTIWYIPPDEHIGLMCFPTVAKSNSKRRSQQMNYECFISTMAELMKKYSDN